MAQVNGFQYCDGRFTSADVSLSIDSKAINYGLGVFEGLRGYFDTNTKKLFVFRLHDHLARLRRGSQILNIPFELSDSEVIEILTTLATLNDWRDDRYIRPILLKNDCTLGASTASENFTFSVFSRAMPGKLDIGAPRSAIISSWQRTSSKMVPSALKLCGGYANIALARGEADTFGADESLMLTSAGNIAEACGANVFLVKNGELVTPSIDQDILNGITRQTIIELAMDVLHIPCVEKAISPEDLYQSEEVFLCGTAAEVKAVGSINGTTIGNGEAGLVTMKLARLYKAVVRGQVPEYRTRWVTEIVKDEESFSVAANA